MTPDWSHQSLALTVAPNPVSLPDWSLHSMHPLLATRGRQRGWFWQGLLQQWEAAAMRCPWRWCPGALMACPT